MKKFTAQIMALFFAFSASVSADSLQDLQGLLTSIKSFQADFSQRTLDADGSVKQIIKGEMQVKKPGFLRWETEGEYAQLVVSDGNSIWIYDQDLENVTIKPMGKEMSETPALLLSGDADSIARDFNVSAGDVVSNKQQFVLKPKDSSQLFDQLNLYFEKGVLVQMIINDASGLATDIQFADAKNNPELDEHLFTFVVPEGVDVIDSRR